MSNTKERIAELRKRIASNKGKASRAEATIWDLRHKVSTAIAEIRRDQREIEDMGGKVRR